MGDEQDLPPALADLVADFEFVDRGLRAEMLIEYAVRFREVAPAIAAPRSVAFSNCSK